MKLNLRQPDVAVQSLPKYLDWSTVSRRATTGAAMTSSSKPDVNRSQQKFQADTWVRLLELPSPFSFDEALLLCQQSEDEWVAWVPNHGEVVLHVRQCLEL